jgi:LPS export ABC transporter protein LptC
MASRAGVGAASRVRPAAVRRAAAVALVAAALAACSFDYEQATVSESLGEQVPDTILEGFSQTVVRDSKPTLVMEASRASTYAASKQVLLVDARFREYDSAGEVAIQGQAGRAIFHTDTENAELSGGIVLYSARDEATLRATSLDWDRDRRLARSAADASVVVEKDDGSRIEGRGFEADFRTHTIRFSAGVSGTVVTDEDKTP